MNLRPLWPQILVPFSSQRAFSVRFRMISTLNFSRYNIYIYAIKMLQNVLSKYKLNFFFNLIRSITENN